jgi:ubiquinone/menaquinone biosynthesis C-methylase UbiE
MMAVDAIEKYLGENKDAKILDVACGTGTVAQKVKNEILRSKRKHLNLPGQREHHSL